MKAIPAEREDLIRRRVEEELARLKQTQNKDDDRPGTGTGEQ